MTDHCLPPLPADAWPDLPEPDFLERDPRAIERRLIERWRKMTGKTLFPGQPERLFIDLMAYEIALARIADESAARLNLLRYARGAVLDYLGEPLQVTRLPAAAAITTLRFSIAAPLAHAVPVPAGTRAAPAGGELAFATDAATAIAPGRTFVDVAATATATGPAANGPIPGQVATPVDAIPFVTAAVNRTETDSGAAIEDDERYRERIGTSADRLSTAGPGHAYRWHTRSVSTLITDVAVLGPEDGLDPGQVEVYPLTAAGLPSGELKARIAAALRGNGADDVVPDTDDFTVKDPVERGFAVALTLTLYAAADATATLAASEAAVRALVDGWRARLGVDIVRDQIEAAALVPGVYAATATAPAASRVLISKEWANCTQVTVASGGTAHG